MKLTNHVAQLIIVIIIINFYSLLSDTKMSFGRALSIKKIE